jgi:PAS domain S-box-containing protein
LHFFTKSIIFRCAFWGISNKEIILSDEYKGLFLAAVQYFYKEHKKQGGTQQQLAKDLGVTQSYLSSILNGSRSSSLDLQIQIANKLYGSFDKFLAAGRNIMEGRSPHEQEMAPPPDDAERLLAHLSHYVVHKQHVEKKLLLSEEKFKDVCLTSSDVVFEMDADMKITYITGKVKEIYGREPEEVLGHKAFEFIDADETERVRAKLDDAITKKSLFNFIVSDKRSTQIRYRNVIGKPLFSAKSDEFIGIRGVSKDVTDKILLKNEIDEHKWLFQSALDAIIEMGVVITDKTNKVLKWNETYREMLGYTTEIIETCNLVKYFSYLEENNLLADPEIFHKEVKETLNSTGETIHEFKLTNGKTIRRRSAPFYNDGEFAGRVSFLIDITKGKRVDL